MRTPVLMAFALLVAVVAPAATRQPAPAPAAQQSPAPVAPAAEMRQFIYVIRPIPRLHSPAGWTEEDSAVAQAHFAHLKALTEKGTIVLAGRTTTLDASTFGIVIFEARSSAEARRVMESDPAIEGGIMTGELFPYEIVLQRSATASQPSGRP